MFRPVTREKNRLRMAIDGPSGSGKTYTALRFAFALAGDDGKVAVIDTEHHTASKYEGESPDGRPWQWDGCNLEHFAPGAYQAAIQHAGSKGYDVLVIDSLSHAWIGVGGALDQADRSKEKNRFAVWRDITPQHTAMIEAIIASPCHIIATLRSKMEYVLEQDDRGKTVPQKVGLKPVQREGVEYEFDIVADLDLAHTMRVSKSRCSVVDGAIVNKPTGAFMESVRSWLFSGRDRDDNGAGVGAVVSPAPTTGSAGAVVAVGAPCADEGQVEKIKQFAQNLGWSPDQLRKVLARKSVARVSDLSRGDAESLIRALEKKHLQAEAEAVF